MNWLSDYPWAFLIIGTVFAAVLLFFDHGETWKNVNAQKGKERIAAIIKLAALWGLMLITVLSGIGTILGADEQSATIAALKSQIGPRHLAKEQRDKLLEELRKNPNGVVYVVPSIFPEKDEALPYAQELLDVIHEAGFDVRVNSIDVKANTRLINVLSWNHNGVFVEIFDKNNSPPQAKFIRDCLGSVGIDTQLYDDSPDVFHNIEKNSIILGIGPR